MASMNLDDARRALSVLTDQMNSDELEVLARFAKKINDGSVKHGRMDLDSDTRDWAVEIQEEMTDAACYMHMREIQYERRMKAGLRELAANAPDERDVGRAATMEGL